MRTTRPSDFARIGKGGMFIRRDAVQAILPTLGACVVFMPGQSPLEIAGMNTEAFLDAITDEGSLSLTEEDAVALGFPKPGPASQAALSADTPTNGKAS